MNRLNSRRVRLATDWLILCLVLTVSAGCTRAYWRREADRQVYCLVNQASSDPRWPLDDYTINIRPQSRFFDPTNPDRPPMPPDDPAAHKLMHCVYCRPGYPCWHAQGDIPWVANPNWENFLPLDERKRLVLDRQGAVELARVNSRDYQLQLETLYEAAMDVTFERFRFEAQFFGTNQTLYTSTGPVLAGVPQGSSELSTTTTPSVNKLFTSGGQLMVETVNTFMWQFAGTNSESAVTLADFTFMQPLLRFGSRAYVMERLTIAERTLLADIRQMELWRRGFYLLLLTGQNPAGSVTRRGGLSGGSGLGGFSGVGGGGFGRLGSVANPNTGAGGFATGGAGAANAGGFLGLLQTLQNIQNLQANVTGLRDSLNQLEAAYDAGRIDRFQVDLARQALFNSQSRLLTAKAQYQFTLDTYKFTMGLPPTGEVMVQDPLLERFELVDPKLNVIQERVSDLLDDLRNPDYDNNQLPEDVSRAMAQRRAAAAQFGVVEHDFEVLDENYDKRITALKLLIERTRNEKLDVHESAYSVEGFQTRVQELKRDFASLRERFEVTSAALVRLEDNAGAGVDRRQLTALSTEVSAQLAELLLVQARARLDSITLVPVNIHADEAMDVARENRLDWMNARMGLIDQWRLIQYNANLLRSNLNVMFNGEIGTTQDKPFRFRGTNGQLQVGLQFDAPLTRLAERNNYRQSLIEFQQARRAYMAFVDTVAINVRNDLRTIFLDQVNFELRRGAVLIAINQVDLTRLRLTQPPRPGETSQFSVTTARDLVDSLGNLLNVENDFLSVWVNYEVQRMELDYDMGTMMLDQHGMWVDPGPVMGSNRPRNEDQAQVLKELDDFDRRFGVPKDGQEAEDREYEALQRRDVNVERLQPSEWDTGAVDQPEWELEVPPALEDHPPLDQAPQQAQEGEVWEAPAARTAERVKTGSFRLKQ